MCSLASGLTPDVLQFCKTRQGYYRPPKSLNPGMVLLVLGSSLRVMNNDIIDVQNSLNVSDIYLKKKPFPSFLF